VELCAVDKFSADAGGGILLQGLKRVFCVRLDESGWQQDERKWTNGHYAVRIIH